jgi:hypothetical protein
MPANQFNTGRDCQLVVIGPNGRVDLSFVTAFESSQVTQQVRLARLDGVHLAAELPSGWEGSFELERGTSAADDFIALLEQAWYTTGQLPGGTLYQYVSETNGSTSTYQYSGCVFQMKNSGVWHGQGSVKQRLHFWASTRTRVG